MFPMQLAQEMSAIPGAGLIKSLLIYALVIVGVLYMVAPAIWEKLKNTMATAIEARLNVQLPFLHSQTYAQPSAYTASTSYAQAVAQPISQLSPQSAGQITQQRAAELKAVCPKATAALRLKWLETGTSPDKARDEYISILEEQLSAPAVPPAA